MRIGTVPAMVASHLTRFDHTSPRTSTHTLTRSATDILFANCNVMAAVTALVVASVIATPAIASDLSESYTSGIYQKLSKQQLGKQLKQAIRSHSGDEGLKAFKLPLSHQLRKIPQDPNNKLTTAKVKLGKLLFHETALGLNPQDVSLEGTYSCASCHHVAAGFKSGIPQGLGEGGTGFAMSGQSRVLAGSHQPDNPDGFVADFQPIASPTVLNTAYQEPMLWNGSFGNSDGSVNGAVDPEKVNNAGPADVFVNKFGFAGLESQAIAGTKVHRLRMAGSIIDEKSRYKKLFKQAFPRGVNGTLAESEVDETWLGAALAIAAYERTVLANKAPFQKWLRGKSNAMSRQELRGGLLFFGKARCVDCHTGPALSSKVDAGEHEIFFNVGFSDLDESDARVHGTIDDATKKGRGGFTGRPEDMYKFKIPQLYNLIDSPIFGHGASFATVREVIEYKNAGDPQRAETDNLSEHFQPLHLESHEIDDLVAFVEDALYDKRLSRYVPKNLPSRMCFPVADFQSALDLGCLR